MSSSSAAGGAVENDGKKKGCGREGCGRTWPRVCIDVCRPVYASVARRQRWLLADRGRRGPTGGALGVRPAGRLSPMRIRARDSAASADRRVRGVGQRAVRLSRYPPPRRARLVRATRLSTTATARAHRYCTASMYDARALRYRGARRTASRRRSSFVRLLHTPTDVVALVPSYLH